MHMKFCDASRFAPAVLMTESHGIQDHCMTSSIIGSIKSPTSYWLVLSSLTFQAALLQCFFIFAILSCLRLGGCIRHLLISVRHRSWIDNKLTAWRPPVLWVFPSSDVVDDHCPAKDEASGGYDTWDETP
jgi:hypothetical protein